MILRRSSVFNRIGGSEIQIYYLMQELEKKIGELKSALFGKDKTVADEQLGDVLLMLVNVARFAKVHPETALLGSVKRFGKRFIMLEKRLTESGRRLEDVPQREKKQIWEKQRNE